MTTKEKQVTFIITSWDWTRVLVAMRCTLTEPLDQVWMHDASTKLARATGEAHTHAAVAEGFLTIEQATAALPEMRATYDDRAARGLDLYVTRDTDRC
jgi:hypothetical protein